MSAFTNFKYIALPTKLQKLDHDMIQPELESWLKENQVAWTLRYNDDLSGGIRIGFLHNEILTLFRLRWM